MQSALQQYPQVSNSAGGAQAAPAGAAPQAQSLSQLQTLLQKFGQRPQGQNGQPMGQSPAMQMGGMGQQMMGQPQQQRPPMPQAMHPMQGPQPIQGAQVPQMAGGMPQGQGQMTPQMLQMLLMQQNGMAR